MTLWPFVDVKLTILRPVMPTTRTGFVGGGYDPCLDTLADRHIFLHEAAEALWTEYQLSEQPLKPLQAVKQ